MGSTSKYDDAAKFLEDCGIAKKFIVNIEVKEKVTGHVPVAPHFKSEILLASASVVNDTIASAVDYIDASMASDPSYLDFGGDDGAPYSPGLRPPDNTVLHARPCGRNP